MEHEDTLEPDWRGRVNPGTELRYICLDTEPVTESRAENFPMSPCAQGSGWQRWEHSVSRCVPTLSQPGTALPEFHICIPATFALWPQPQLSTARLWKYTVEKWTYVNIWFSSQMTTNLWSSQSRAAVPIIPSISLVVTHVFSHMATVAPPVQLDGFTRHTAPSSRVTLAHWVEDLANIKALPTCIEEESFVCCHVHNTHVYHPLFRSASAISLYFLLTLPTAWWGLLNSSISVRSSKSS